MQSFGAPSFLASAKFPLGPGGIPIPHHPKRTELHARIAVARRRAHRILERDQGCPKISRLDGLLPLGQQLLDRLLF